MVFLIGQNAAIELGIRAAPELEPEFRMAKAKFDANFAGVEQKLEAILKTNFTATQWQTFQKVARDEISRQLGSVAVTPKSAASFVKELQNRGDGVIASPLLQYLLAVQYDGKPASEFLNGYRQTYVGNGQGKSKGLLFDVQMPLSWKASDGDRPNIVQSWTSANGTGLEFVSVLVRDLPSPISKTDIAELLQTSDGQKELVPVDARLKSARSTTIETYPGYHLEFERPMERAGLSTFTVSGAYTVFTTTHMLTLLCMTSGLTAAEARKAFDNLRPLCQQVASSVVMPQRYGR